MITRLLDLGMILDGIQDIQTCYQVCRTAGFQIDSHLCWQAICSDCSPFDMQAVTDRKEKESLLHQAYHPTALSAIRAAIPAKEKHLSWLEQECALA